MPVSLCSAIAPSPIDTECASRSACGIAPTETPDAEPCVAPPQASELDVRRLDCQSSLCLPRGARKFGT